MGTLPFAVGALGLILLLRASATPVSTAEPAGTREPGGRTASSPVFHWVPGGQTGQEDDPTTSYDFTLFDGDWAVGYFTPSTLSFHEHQPAPGVVSGHSRRVNTGTALTAQSRWWEDERIEIDRPEHEVAPNRFTLRATVDDAGWALFGAIPLRRDATIGNALAAAGAALAVDLARYGRPAIDARCRRESS